MLTVTTQDGATYSLMLRASGLHGRVLAVSRTGGADDPPVSNKPMEQGRWYHVNVLDPLPPQIGSQLSMVLDPILYDPDPLVRRTGMVTSVVGLLEPRAPEPAPRTPEDEPAPPVPRLLPPVAASEPVSPRAAADAVAAGSDLPFLNADRKLVKASGLFAAVLGVATLLGRHR